MRRRGSLGLLAALLVGAGVPAAAQVDPLVGCYRVEVGEWEMRGHSALGRSFGIPAEFRLLPEPWGRVLRGDSVVRRRVLPVRPGDGQVSFWRRVPADSLSVIWGNGFWGVRLWLGIAGDSLVGTAHSFSDDIWIDENGRIVEPTAPATAHRIPCG